MTNPACAALFPSIIDSNPRTPLPAMPALAPLMVRLLLTATCSSYVPFATLTVHVFEEASTPRCTFAVEVNGAIKLLVVTYTLVGFQTNKALLPASIAWMTRSSLAKLSVIRTLPAVLNSALLISMVTPAEIPLSTNRAAMAWPLKVDILVKVTDGV